MSETSLALDAFERDMERLLAEKRLQRLSKFDQNALAWLALVPTWTEQLARECDFPGKERLYDFVYETQAAGLSLLRQSTNPDRSTWYMAYVYTMLAPYLQEVWQRDALTFVRQIRDPRLRSQTLAKLAPHLTDELVPLMLVTAQAIEDPGIRAVPLLALIPRLSAEQQSLLLDELFSAVPLIAHVEEQMELLLGLIPHLAENKRLILIRQVLALRTELNQESQQVSVLTNLIPHLPAQLLPDIMETAGSLTRIESRVQVYIALAAQAPPDIRAAVLSRTDEVLESALDLEKETRAYLLSMLVLMLAHSGEFDRALTLAEEVVDEDIRVQIFIEIVQAMGEFGELMRALELVQRVLKTTLRMADAASNVSMLFNMAQTLYQIGEKTEAARIVREALDAAVPLISNAHNVYVLSGLAAALIQLGESTEATQVVERALEATRSVSSVKDRCKALVNLIPLVSSDMREWVVREALGNARRIGDIGIRIQELVTLVPFLEENELLTVLVEALQLANAMQEEFSFWMPDTVRAEVLTSLSQADPNFLLTKIREIGPRIVQAQSSGFPISPTVIHWAELASRAQSGTERVARWLDRQIEQLVKEGDTGQALAWVNSATFLLPVLQGELEMSIILGNRRVELSYRQSQDERHLQYFLQRQEQVDAFMGLIQLAEPNNSSTWALHYMGIGGIGKTTLIRYITTSVAPGLGIPTSRIDFDYLNPEYPSRRPGQLLIELAKELQAYGTKKKQDTLFRSFQQRVVHFHETLSSAPTAADPLDSVRHPEFLRVLQAFCDFLSALPQPVVFILDTCEELAKFQPPGAAPPNLSATFDILERIHKAVPYVRVIFAGRRFLTQEGADWSLDEQRIQSGQSLLRDKKDYLLLHEIRGFTEEEALYFLTVLKKLDISSELQQAILRRSQDAGTSASINRLPLDIVEHAVRYNPFDLALYADWVREDSRLTPEMINRGKTDPYVEMRIVNRIRREDVLRLLPAALLMHRFDKAMLRLAFDGSDAEFTEVYGEIGNLEWIEYQPEDTIAFLEIDRNLYPRLLEYYKHPERRRLLDIASQRLKAGLFELVMNLPLHQLYVDHVEAAIKLLPEEQAATLWDSIAQNIANNAAWGKARAITERLLDNSAPVIGEHHLARAAIRATFISVLLHEQPEFSVISFWDEVARTARADPDPIVSKWLQQRAFVGNIAAMCRARDIPGDAQLANFWRLVAQFPHTIHDTLDADESRVEQWAGSLCAAIEALLDLTEQKGVRNLISSPEVIAHWATVLQKGNCSLELQAFAFLLAGRAMALHERWGEASRFFESACDACPKDIVRSRHQRWLDWRVPSSLHDRVRLEALRSIPHHLLTISIETWRLWQQEALERLTLIDADRLVSYTLTLCMAHEVVPRTTLDMLATNDFLLPGRQPECEAHRVIPPLFFARALALLALGEGAEALRLVDERIQDIASKRIDKENAVLAAENVKTQIMRRMRAANNFPTFFELYTRPNTLEVQATMWPAIALGCSISRKLIPRSIETENLFLVHSWWRCSQASTNSLGFDMFSFSSRAGLLTDPGSSESFERISLAMDLQEVQILLKETHRSNMFFVRESWLAIHPTQIEQALRLWLRAIALGVASPYSSQEGAQLSQKFGPRRIAELALDEGEMLAFRLPQDAKLLLDLANEMFGRANDHVGAFIATICSVIASIRAGISSDERPVLINRLKTVYERLPEFSMFKPLPWNELLSVVPTSRLQLGGIWQGWLERLLSCTRWLTATGDENGAAFSSLVRDWLIPQYGEPLPDELDLPKIGTADQIEEKREDTHSESFASFTPSPRRISNGVLLLIAFSLSVLLILLMAGAGLVLLNTGLQLNLGGSCNRVLCGLVFRYPESIISLFITLLVSPFLMGAYFLTLRQLRSIRAELSAQTRLSLSIEGEEVSLWQNLSGEDSWTILVRMRQQRQALHLGWPLTSLQTKTSIAETSQISGVQAYNRVAKTLPVIVVKELTSLQKHLGRQKLPIPLDIYPGFQAIPWEALFTLALPTSSQISWNETFQFWRLGDPQPTYRETQIALEERLPFVGVLSSLTWRLMVTRGWRKPEQDIQICDTLKELDRFRYSIKILHVICTPTSSTLGWLLQLENTNQFYESSKEAAVGQTVRSEGSLIRIEDLPLTTASLVVLQAEPVETVQRLDTERDLAADLRCCAALAFSAGAKTVIMLPALPAQLTELVLHQLAACYEKQDAPKLQSILETVSKIRNIIARWSPLEDEPSLSMQEQIVSDTQLELALDVCVFARAHIF